MINTIQKTNYDRKNKIKKKQNNKKHFKNYSLNNIKNKS